MKNNSKTIHLYRLCSLNRRLCIYELMCLRSYHSHSLKCMWKSWLIERENLSKHCSLLPVLLYNSYMLNHSFNRPVRKDQGMYWNCKS